MQPDPGRKIKPTGSLHAGYEQIPNHGPVVKIIRPLKNEKYVWNSLVPYSIEVTDAEDGESKFQEIQSAEVLVKIKYVENSIKANTYLKQKEFGDSAGILSMLVSNCFNCHAVRTKMAGPSFQDISRKYQNNPLIINQLVSHIQKGSMGIWGKEAMSSHPELTEATALKMAKWILKYAKDPGLNYIVGLQGVLPLSKPISSAGQGIYLMTALYIDHGTNDFPDKRMTGSDQLMIQMLQNSAK